MMYLLDTNAFIFLLEKNYSRLSNAQLSIIENLENDLFICEASLFEIAIKTRLEKSNFSKIDMKEIENDRKRLNIKLLKSKTEHYQSIVSIPKVIKNDGKLHADPFDLLIIATAQCNQLPVLSSDEYFPEYSIIKTIN